MTICRLSSGLWLALLLPLVGCQLIAGLDNARVDGAGGAPASGSDGGSGGHGTTGGTIGNGGSGGTAAEAGGGGASSVTSSSSAGGGPMMTTLTLYASQDCDIEEATPMMNFNGFNASVSGGVNPKAPLFQYDLSSIPAGSVVDKVTLRLLTSNETGCSSNASFNVYRLLESWGESTATWEMRDAANAWGAPGAAAPDSRDATPVSLTSFVPAALDSVYFVDLQPSLVQGWLDGTTPNHGIVIGPVTPSNAGGACFRGREEPSSHGTHLIVTFH